MNPGGVPDVLIAALVEIHEGGHIAERRNSK